MSAECSQHGIHLVGLEDAYCPLCRCSELRAENERLKEALVDARPYVYGRVADQDWRGETARQILGRVDSALSGESDG